MKFFLSILGDKGYIDSDKIHGYRLESASSIVDCQRPCVDEAGGLVVASLAEGVAQPLETLVETVTGGGAGGLDVLQSCQYKRGFQSCVWGSAYPCALPQAVQAKLVSDLSGVHGVLACLSVLSLPNVIL